MDYVDLEHVRLVLPSPKRYYAPKSDIVCKSQHRLRIWNLSVSYANVWSFKLTMRLIVLLGFQVGMPNVGISTLFNKLKLSTPAENYPFCTMEPNEARVYIPDERFEWLCQMYKPKSEVSDFNAQYMMQFTNTLLEYCVIV